MMRALLRPRRAALVVLVLGAATSACNSDKATSSSGGISLGNPSYQLGVPAAISVRQRATTTVPVTIVRTDYSGPVFVTFAGLPKGVTAPTVSSTTNDQLSITLTADSSSVPGVTSVTVNSTGIDVTARTTTFTLTVAANP